jgi:hypothetical protein
MPHAESPLLQQLSNNSAPYRDPLSSLDWTALNAHSYWLPPPAISIYGLPEFATLNDDVKRRLSQYEFINVILCGLWLESIFIDRLGSALAGGLSAAERTYLLHEIREEAGHSLMFLKLIEASGLPLPERAWRPPRLTDAAGRRLPVTGPLFWLATAIGEDIPDKFNRYLRQHGGDQINPLVRQLCTLHIVDEARHVAYARQQLEVHLAGTGPLYRRCLNLALNPLLRQFALRFYVPPAEFYELAGLTRGAWWRRAARADPRRREFVRERMAPTLRMLEHYGFSVTPH